ncbi:angiopoietin-related protein 1-like [Culex pipiens pallens]|uniref:angiopoietin-related protein 1-like n=1 Tax=Culex pipiens pallens TaxID=42434 RepID=UPI0022AA345C|nr:angiopoietin-related protein 1-like [Culex pipiens pallens]
MRLKSVEVVFLFHFFAQYLNGESLLSTTSPTSLPTTCSRSTNRHSGVQLIHPQPGFREPFQVFCDQEFEDGGWVVIQNRFEGSVYFHRDWREYERGFGNIEGEFWLGLGKIHELSYSRRYELVVVLEDWDGVEAIARYSEFLVAGPVEKYELKSLGTFEGSAGDSMQNNVGMGFSTFDADHDLHPENCAEFRRGAWWYRYCNESNLNALYMRGLNETSMFWLTFRDHFYGLKRTRMMIRAVV